MAYRTTCSSQIVLLIGLLLIGASLPTDVRADDRTWDNDAGDNDWLNSANWAPDGGPDWSDNLTVYSGSPGADPASPPVVSVTAGGSITIEPPEGSTASASFDHLLVGKGSSGTLRINRGGTVYAHGEYSYVGCTMGSPNPGTGTAIVDGGEWVNTGQLYVGHWENAGTLLVKQGGEVTNTFGFIGGPPDASSAATVDGVGSTWTNAGDLYIGASGTGTLNIQNGGRVTNALGRIGFGFDSPGTVTVDGAGSTWTNQEVLQVSFMAPGTLNIQNGGVVSSASGEIASFGSNPEGPPGSVTIDGAGSLWITSGGLYVNRGTLHLSNQGSVSVAATLTIRDGTLDVGPGDTQIDARVVSNGVVDVQEGSVLTFSGEVHGRGGFPGPGTIVFEDQFVPGGYNARTVDFGGSVEFRPTSTLRLELAGYSDEVRHDLIAVRGTSPSRLDGTLNLAAFRTAPAGGHPRLTEDVPIVQAEGAAVLKGQFASGPPRQYDPAAPVPSHLGTGVFCRELTYVEAPGSLPEDPSYARVTVDLFEALSGDNNGDGLVDGADLDRLSANWSLPADPADRTWTDGDTSSTRGRGDGRVDGQDFNDLLSNFAGDPAADLPGEASAIYDWTTGEFWVSINGQVKNWVLKSPGRLNGPDNQAADILPLETILPVTSISNNPNTVGEGFVSEDLDSFLEPQTGVYLGVLTGPFTPLIDYDTEEPYFELEYVRGAGLPKQYGQITVIPEPATLSLLAAALLAALMWPCRAARRRSSAAGESLTRRAPPP